MRSAEKNKFIETGMTLVGIFGSLATIPQVIKVFYTHSAHAVALSLITWCSYALIACLWVAYGIYFKKMAILVTNVIYFFMYLLVIIGLLINCDLTW